MTRDLELHINVLVVDGVAGVDGVRMGDAFTRELVRLLEGGSASAGLSGGETIDRMDAGAVTSRARDSAALGASVARAVHRELVP
jgi:hypothetical protein